MNAKKILFGDVKEAIEHFLTSLGENATDVVTELNTNPSFRKTLGEFAVREASRIQRKNVQET